VLVHLPRINIVHTFDPENSRPECHYFATNSTLWRAGTRVGTAMADRQDHRVSSTELWWCFCNSILVTSLCIVLINHALHGLYSSALLLLMAIGLRVTLVCGRNFATRKFHCNLHRSCSKACLWIEMTARLSQ
jgi:hypothetical protein